MTMDEEVLVDVRRPTWPRHAASMLSLLLVLASVYGGFFVRVESPSHLLDAGIALRGALAFVGFIGLLAPWVHRGYFLSTLLLTVIPGLIALGVLLVFTVVGWSMGLDRFWSSWSAIGGWFSLTSPFFSPPVAAGLLLLIDSRARWVKAAAAMGVISGCALLSLYAHAASYGPVRLW